MTPEEKAVIEAAIIMYHEGQNDHWTACSVVVNVGKLLAKQALLSDGETAVIKEPSDPHQDAVEAAMEETYGAEQEWLPATFAECLTGDRIRIGDQESDVLWTTGPQRFHAKGREWIGDDGKVRDFMTRWDHDEVRMDLSANSGRREYVPSTACEILCTPERAAALMLNAKPVDK